MKNKIYYIIEVANTHGGDIDYLYDLIKEFEPLKNEFGIKFQPFKYDCIATQDYNGYELYQKLYFNPDQWENIIDKATKTKDVWLDLFDTYGVNIFKENISKIHGIKLQSSVLYNYEVFDSLIKLDMSDKLVILNIAAQDLNTIKEIINRFQTIMCPKEILLEFGYQGYPTLLEYSGISKIRILQEHFNNRLVFADHTDGTTDDAIDLPLFVSELGISIIEKHVMLDNKETNYDAYSSLTPNKYKQMVEKINNYHSLLDKDFINEKEQDYLDKTIMIPILKNNKQAGDLLSIKDDLCYRRSGKTGMNIKEIEEIIGQHFVLAKDKIIGDSLFQNDFRKATIATVIACRLKSTRLPKKALLKIGSLPSVELCIKNSLRYDDVDYTILATSNLPDDAELEKHTFSDKVLFFAGDPEDVIRRYLDAIQNLNVDMIIRLTADCPFVLKEILDYMLNQHFITGADYSGAKEASVGTACEILNVKALKNIKEYFPNANYSEYMTWYFRNNPEYFRLNIVNLPSPMVRNYRLTLDCPEDLEMFNYIQNYFEKNHLENTMENLFEYLDNHPEICTINSKLVLKYRADKELIATLDRETKMHN